MKSFIHIIPSLVAGGGENLLALTCEIIKRKHYIICLTKPGFNSKRILLTNSKIYYPFFNFLDFLKVSFLIFKALQNRQFICQGWMYYGDLGAILIHIFSFGRIKSRLFLLTTATNKNMSLGSIISRKISSYLSRVIDTKIFAISETCKRSHILIGYPENKFFILNPPIVSQNNASFEDIIEKKRKRKKETQILRVIMAARFDKVKNHQLLFRLYEHFKGDFILDLYGNGISSNNKNLMDLIRRNISHDNLKNLSLKGEIKDLISRFVDYDYIILTSLEEGLPITIIEASQNALIPISSDVGDVIEASSGCGFFFKNNSFSDLLDKFIKARKICEEDRLFGNKSKYYLLSKNIFEKSNSRWHSEYFIENFLN